VAHPGKAYIALKAWRERSVFLLCELVDREKAIGLTPDEI
jgi:hypothetical protein